MQSNPQIIVDTREQRPFQFVDAIIKALPTGDYSVAGLEHVIAIERKSASDMLGCIGQSRDRFERELARLAQIQYRGVIVEGSLTDLLTPGRSAIHPSAILGSLVAWSWRYGIAIWFADNRELAERLTYRLLLKAAEYAARDGT